MLASSTGDYPVGVYGYSSAFGVYAGGSNYGVYGWTDSATGGGVYGQGYGTSGSATRMRRGCGAIQASMADSACWGPRAVPPPTACGGGG